MDSIPLSWTTLTFKLGVFALLCFLPLPAQSQTHQLVPQDVTVMKGQSALFQCKPADSQDRLKWYAFHSQKTPVREQKLFEVAPTDKTPMYLDGVDTNKYQNNDTYNLIVVNAQADDGITYGCSSTSATPLNVYANLVVIESLEAKVTPSTGLREGVTVTLGCNLYYGAPNTSISLKPLSEEQNPRISMYLGNMDLNAPVYIVSNGMKFATINRTITKDIAGKDLRCDVMSIANGVTTKHSESMTLPIHFPPTDMMVNKSADMRVGDSINCTVRGYPAPTVKWVALSLGLANPTESSRGSGWALLTFKTAGSNRWNCTAKDSSKPNSVPLSMSYTFNVRTMEGQSVSDNSATSCKIENTLFVSLLAIVFILFSSKHLFVQ